MDAREAHKAVTAMERGIYGTYSVTVYAKDTQEINQKAESKD